MFTNASLQTNQLLGTEGCRFCSVSVAGWWGINRCRLSPVRVADRSFHFPGACDSEVGAGWGGRSDSKRGSLNSSLAQLPGAGEYFQTFVFTTYHSFGIKEPKCIKAKTNEVQANQLRKAFGISCSTFSLGFFSSRPPRQVLSGSDPFKSWQQRQVWQGGRARPWEVFLLGGKAFWMFWGAFGNIFFFLFFFH